VLQQPDQACLEWQNFKRQQILVCSFLGSDAHFGSTQQNKIVTTGHVFSVQNMPKMLLQ